MNRQLEPLRNRQIFDHTIGSLRTCLLQVNMERYERENRVLYVDFIGHRCPVLKNEPLISVTNVSYISRLHQVSET
jgi:hypothetical protein